MRHLEPTTAKLKVSNFKPSGCPKGTYAQTVCKKQSQCRNKFVTISVMLKTAVPQKPHDAFQNSNH